MSKWRPVAQNCLYTIPDIHGNVELLMKICDRILPLRKSDGGKDHIVFLGDYIDRHEDSHKVIDFCIDLQKQYPTQITFLMGNHEHILLKSINAIPNKNLSLQDKFSAHRMWIENGGDYTTVGYLERSGQTRSWGSLQPGRIADLMPKSHIEFLQNLKKYYETEDFIFVHGGMDPNVHPSKTSLEEIIWDRDLVKKTMHGIQNKNLKQDWEKPIICGHSVQKSLEPIITQKFMMLDCGSPKQLLVVEMNSLEAYMAYPNQSRMVKYELKETVAVPVQGFVKRSS